MAPSYQDRIKYTLASHAVEKLRPSDDAIQLCDRVTNREISTEDAIAAILKKYGVSLVRSHE